MARITGYSYIPKVYKNPDTNQFVQVYLPMISVRVSINLGQISPSFDAVADSGSERNLFPIFLAKYLRIDFGKTKPNRDGFFHLFKSIKFDEKGQFVYIEE